MGNLNWRVEGEANVFYSILDPTLGHRAHAGSAQGVLQTRSNGLIRSSGFFSLAVVSVFLEQFWLDLFLGT